MKTEITTSDNKSPSKPSLRELRNEFLIAWATYHGPRGQEIRTATWALDNTGNFYKKNENWHYQYTPKTHFFHEKSRKRIEYQLADEATEAIESLTLRLNTRKQQLEAVRFFPNYPVERPNDFSPGKFRHIIATEFFLASIKQPETTGEMCKGMMPNQLVLNLYEQYRNE